MVSPSKLQQQEQKQQPSKEYILDKCSYVRIQKGLKPLAKKSFYLDIKNHAISAKLEAKIKDLGGVIELFLVRTVSLVVTDRIDKVGQINSEKYKWGCISGGSGGTPSLRSLEIPTPTPPTSLLSSECPLYNTTNLQGHPTQRSKSRTDAMLERALTQPQHCSVDPLENALNWGITICTTEKIQAWLDKIYASLQDTNNLKQLQGTSRQRLEKDLKVKHLRGSYVKFESLRRDKRPVFLELSTWPTLNFDGDPGTSPFDTKRRGKLENKTDKEVKENREAIAKKKECQGKEMTRRPRTTAARARRTEQLGAGFCEICRIDYCDLSKHVESDQHLNFVQNDDNFLSLDRLINTNASVEAFLKLNRTKDIGEECNIFTNEERTLRDELPEEKVTKNAKTLNNFSVQGINMVQCNGTQRNLNLKLNSPHNLRTRAKHESGHLLRSKGSPWHEIDKNEKFYDKLEGFTIKKRAKGTIWIEEEDPENKYSQASDIKNSDQVEYNIKSTGKDLNGIHQREYGDNNSVNKRRNGTDNQDKQDNQEGKTLDERIPTNKQNGVFHPELPSKNANNTNVNNRGEINENRRSTLLKNNVNINGLSDKNNRIESWHSTESKDKFDGAKNELELQRVSSDSIKVGNDHNDKKSEVLCSCDTENNQKGDIKVVQCMEKDLRCEKLRSPRACRRGGRSFRGRHRLSVEERLIEDNRAYYKVEVLGSKLRSSTLPGNNNALNPTIKDADEIEKKEQPSSEKPVVVRFKRVRKSELSLLSDEAESFMFGEPKREDTSEDVSDEEQTSVLPRDTESEFNETVSSDILSSSVDSSPEIKQEILEEDSQDSVNLGRARKRRRTQAEALIKDNVDYYKFETPGSRLRYQAPLTGVRASLNPEDPVNEELRSDINGEVIEKIYPSKPSAEVERMQFSFEVIPKSEPWYQTYQRQDEGAEFWHYFSDGDTGRPFLLPYEIENFHETILRNQAKNENRKKGKGRSIGCIGRSPRKSPRCHASTLAIMSTIIRKREQQQLTSNICTREECQSPKSQINNTPLPKVDSKIDIKADLKTDTKADQKLTSEIDEELKKIAKNIDEMLNMRDSLDIVDMYNGLEEEPFIESNLPKGPPANLLELLDNCHELVPCIENSSCASSECGEVNVESPLKRRKRRKNRTGWPGIKIRKKMQNKIIVGSSYNGQGNYKLSREKNVAEQNVGLSEKNTNTNSNTNGDVNAVAVADADADGDADADAADADVDMSQRLMADTRTEIVLSNGSTISFTTNRHDEKTSIDKKNNKSTSDNYNDDPSVSSKASSKTSLKTSSKASSKTCPKTCLSLAVISKNKNTENTGTKNCTVTDGLKITKVFSEAQRTLSDKNFTLNMEEEEVSENNPGNDENHENVFRKDVNGVVICYDNGERQFITKGVVKKRPRINTSSESCESRTEIENHDILLSRKDIDSGIVSRKHSSSDVSRLGCQQTHSENSNIEVDAHRSVYRRSKVGVVTPRQRVNTRKQQRRNNKTSSESVYESENCKKESYLNITCKKQETIKNSKKQSNETIGPSTDVQDSAELECALSERNTPTTATTIMPSSGLKQRRSSIEFQPVVRMMKIDNSVDMDHSILSVTVASNRRLRSSNSHNRPDAQPPHKRLKTSRGQFRRWLKSS
ncbi:PREDICTED: uncharacterized protein LOC106789681 isoform X1 [Polistes canadensis]|uniref:uncharacterized protein LOC106789681 isoform X1 n=1 Tax=Polistes canadensis TaxID=91411 RepID=UPI000718C75D|nr:PREDICTED: uncharacterized protein LOC106789681 isoform X1 [Polistes canadensis]